MSDTKIQCVKVMHPNCGKNWCLYTVAQFSLADEFDGAEIGEQIVLELCEMTQSELDALPDFEGW